MTHFFNTEGPCRPEWHYMISPPARLPEVGRLIRDGRYFILHAPRQSGKTTLIATLSADLRAQGVVALWASLLPARGISDVERSERLWLDALQEAAAVDLPAADWPPEPAETTVRGPGYRLGYTLAAWCRKVAPRPVVLFLDEADAVQGEAMASLLAQLRTGFDRRAPGVFPVSIALIGLRNLRDYLIEVQGRPFNVSSPFNSAASLTLPNFSCADVAALYGQHTDETGQVFTPEAIDLAFWWTDGQPYLINALARQCIDVEVPDRRQPILPEHIDRAQEALTRARVVHLDHLDQRLNEERVARVIAPILASAELTDLRSDDFEYCVDLGMLKRDNNTFRIANRWYQQVLPRALAISPQMGMPAPTVHLRGA